MLRKSILVSLTLAAVLSLHAAATAGPPYYIGEWGWMQHCPQGDYSFFHYWTPGAYKVRAAVHPSNVDQFVPAPAVPIIDNFNKQKCMPQAPEVSRPYSNPEGYYGRKVLPDAGGPLR